MPTIRDVIDEKIAWFWGFPIPGMTVRDLDLGEPLRPSVGNRVKVVVGVRRCGKTWRLYQEVARLERAGVDRRKILYFNFDDERLKPYDRLLPSQVMERFYTLSPDARQGAYVFFDEIQDVPDWGVFMRRMVDTEQVSLYVTGSSSKMLSVEVATEFRGRATSYELSPYSFREFARCRGAREATLAPGALRGEQDRLDLARMCSDYLTQGGYPEAQGMGDVERVGMLQDIAANVVAADVVERHDLGGARTARMVAMLCLASSSRKLSLTKLHNRLKSQGVAIGWEGLTALVGYLEEANLMYRIPEYTTSVAENSRKASKAYANDQSLMVAVSAAASEDAGLALETAVYLELRRRASFGRKNSIMTYAPKDGQKTLEVDFVEGDALLGEVRSLVQVCADMTGGVTRNRELRALEIAMGEIGADRGAVVTLDAEQVVNVKTGIVEVVPAWRWLLGDTVLDG